MLFRVPCGQGSHVDQGHMLIRVTKQHKQHTCSRMNGLPGSRVFEGHMSYRLTEL